MKQMSEKRKETLERNIQSAKLGKAKTALKKLANYKMDEYEDYDDAFIHMRIMAQNALKSLECVLKEKKAKRYKIYNCKD